MLPSWISMFIDSSKVASYTRGLVAGGLSLLILKYPLAGVALDPTTQGLIATAVSGIAVGIWGHLVKS